MSTRVDPFTHRHPLKDMSYSPTGAKCGGCGMRWFIWETKDGHKMYLTDPKRPKGHKP